MTPDAVPQVPVDPPSSSDPAASSAVNTQTAPSVDPAAPPPADDVAQAGAEVPPADAPPGGALGAAAPHTAKMILDDFDPDLAALANPTLIESHPITGDEPLSQCIDTPAKALEVLGAESGVPAGTVDNVTLISVAIPEEREPADVIDELRRKLYAYGEECYNAVRPEVEYLQQLHTRL